MKSMTRRDYLRALALAAGGVVFGAPGWKAAAQQNPGDVVYAVDVVLSADDIEQIRSMNLRMGLNTNHNTDDFINLLMQSGQAAAEEYGIDLIADHAGFDDAKQLADVMALVEQRVDGIFIVAVNNATISPAIIAANEAGIPVVVIGGAPARGEVLAVMNSTNYDGCYESARFLISAVGRQGKIGVISIPLAVPAIRERELGALNAIRESRMSVIGIQPVWTAADAQAVVRRMIQLHPDLKAIFATWSLAVTGALAAIEESGLNIKLAGYDAEAAGFEAFYNENPYLLALAGQQPIVQGRTGIDALCKAVLGERSAPYILVPTPLITPSNYQRLWDDLYPGIPAPWEIEAAAAATESAG